MTLSECLATRESLYQRALSRPAPYGAIELLEKLRPVAKAVFLAEPGADTVSSVTTGKAGGLIGPIGAMLLPP